MMAVTTRKKINVLRKAITVLKENKWMRYHVAYNQYNEPVPPLSSDAVCFCAYGALQHAQKDDNVSLLKSKVVADQILREVFDHTNVHLVSFNDHYAHGKRDVIRVLEKTVKALESQ